MAIHIVTFFTESHGVQIIPTIADNVFTAIKQAARMIPFVTSEWTAQSTVTDAGFADLVNKLNETAYSNLCDFSDGNEDVEDAQYDAGIENYHLVANAIWDDLSDNN